LLIWSLLPQPHITILPVSFSFWYYCHFTLRYWCFLRLADTIDYWYFDYAFSRFVTPHYDAID